MKVKIVLLVVIASSLLLLLAAPALAASQLQTFYWTAGDPQVTVRQGDVAVFNYVVVNSHPAYPEGGLLAQCLQILKQDGRDASYPALVTADLGARPVYRAWDYPANVAYPLSATLTVDLPPGSYLWRIYSTPWFGNVPNMPFSHMTVLPAQLRSAAV